VLHIKKVLLALRRMATELTSSTLPHTACDRQRSDYAELSSYNLHTSLQMLHWQ